MFKSKDERFALLHESREVGGRHGVWGNVEKVLSVDTHVDEIGLVLGEEKGSIVVQQCVQAHDWQETGQRACVVIDAASVLVRVLHPQVSKGAIPFRGEKFIRGQRSQEEIRDVFRVLHLL